MFIENVSHFIYVNSTMANNKTKSKCHIPNCTRDPSLSVYKLPVSTNCSRNIVREKWIKVLHLNPDVTEFYVCSRHFTADDFKISK